MRKVHLVVSTHWDREWYQPFQGFRYRLVSLFDELLDKMEKDPRFHAFQTDGQAVILEDYLEIRPEKMDLIKQFASEGRLEIGPGYVLPDEFIISGESLIRNLKEGIRVGKEFGNRNSVPFACDIFGHNSQMPQIIRGFGYEGFLMWRGLNENQVASNFIWKGADGSEVITFRFGPRWGYCDFAFRTRKGSDTGYLPTVEEIAEGIIEGVHLEAQRTPAKTLMIFDGGDHFEIEPNLPDAVDLANQKLRIDGFEVAISTLSNYFGDLIKERNLIVSRYEGECREPGSGVDEQWLIPGVLSSRIQQKQANRRCEDILCFWAEPFSAIAREYGMKGSEGFIHAAWRYLLKNHAHDSICGCSPDQIHKDMDYRFDQAEMIANLVTQDALKHMALSIPGEITKTRFPILVANPTSFEISEMIDLTLDLPADCSTYQEFFGYEPKPGFRIFDSNNEEVPYQLIRQDLNRSSLYIKRRKFPRCEKVHQVGVTLPLDLPSVGTRTLWVETMSGPTRHPQNRLIGEGATLSNGLLTVLVEANGTLAMIDHTNEDEIYSGFLGLEDSADIGDGWFHGFPVNDEVYTSDASHAAVALVNNGAFKATLKIEVTLQVPSCFQFDRMVRSRDRSDLKVIHWVTLRKGSKRVEVMTEVENTVKDHRLRVLFPYPSEEPIKTYFCDSPFDVVERAIDLRQDNHTYRELEVETRPQYTWTALKNNEGGIALVSTGLPESAIVGVEEPAIALTLLRAFRKTPFTDGETGGQIQGNHCFRYWLIPFNGDLNPVVIGRLGQQLAAGIRVQQRHYLDAQKEGPIHPDRFSLLNVDGNVLVTSIRPTGTNGLMVRLYNPTTKPTTARILMNKPVARASRCNFLDEEMESISPKEKKIAIRVKPKEIINILVE